ncbi:MAG: DUF4954 family protein [Candidatus Symbiothrix sp.]|jgi:NDP-sugar pyrophosphorylase family protein|nr:DUF4954 family protein [Candidatus Symbiothrix sp.]
MYRKLTLTEITWLESQNCSAKNWRNIEVVDDFDSRFVKNVHFSGFIRLGKFDETFFLAGGIPKTAGIYHATLHNCIVGDNVLIENVHNYIANYTIGNHVIIQNVDSILVDEISNFGNGTEISILDETGSKTVKINNWLSSHLAYLLVMYRRRTALIEQLNQLIDRYINKKKSDQGYIGEHTTIRNTSLIRNVKIGDYAIIQGASRLENGTLNSSKPARVRIGYNVIAQDFIVLSGTTIEDGVQLTRCFVGQACHLGKAFTAVDSLFFANCHFENGEACAVFAGPYTVSHHKSTLLIGGMFSFFNAGSGTNQSNHAYKLGPMHQGVLERGCKTSSDAYLLFPAQIGAFSFIMGRHYRHSNTSDLPFSYLIERDGESFLIPAMNLISVGTLRDSLKFPQRDGRRDPHQPDFIRFDLFNPYIAQKLSKGIEILKSLREKAGKDLSVYTYQACKISASALNKGIGLYEKALSKYFGDVLQDSSKNQSITDEGAGEWLDFSGLILPASVAESLFDRIENGEIKDLEALANAFGEIHQNYPAYERNYINSRLQNQDLKTIIEAGKAASTNLNKAVYEDAKKDFCYPFDFEPTMDDFERNAFVASILRKIEESDLQTSK